MTVYVWHVENLLEPFDFKIDRDSWFLVVEDKVVVIYEDELSYDGIILEGIEKIDQFIDDIKSARNFILESEKESSEAK